MSQDSVILSGNETTLKPIITLLMGLHMMGLSDSDIYYKTPIVDYQTDITFRPQITLMFREDNTSQLKIDGLSPVKSEVSFRLMNETSATMNESKAKAWGNRIKEILSTYSWQRGHVQVSYEDSKNGVDWRVLCDTETTGIGVISHLIESIVEKPFNEQLIRTSTSKASFPTTPPLQFIYGEERRAFVKRRVATVKFRYAYMHVHGVTHPVLLYDKSGRRLDVLSP